MNLSDADIQKKMETGDLVIEPLENPELQLQPASVDFRLSNEFLTFNNQNITSFNPLEDNPEEHMEKTVVNDDEQYIVHPGDFVLASTKEWIEIPDDLIGFVDGRSTLGRLGLVIHSTAGLLDPGWKGNVTLEISNHGSVPLELSPDMRVGQLTFTELKTPSERPYGVERGSKYQNQSGVQSARTDHQTSSTPGSQSRFTQPSDDEDDSSSPTKIGFN